MVVEERMTAEEEEEAEDVVKTTVVVNEEVGEVEAPTASKRTVEEDELGEPATKQGNLMTAAAMIRTGETEVVRSAAETPVATEETVSLPNLAETVAVTLAETVTLMVPTSKTAPTDEQTLLREQDHREATELEILKSAALATLTVTAHKEPLPLA